ncbi:MAG: DUF1289 domain-containing protein [Idiomarina sp.]|nr:DUF1289 domain-containing protein [Idiomarina sp.]
MSTGQIELFRLPNPCIGVCEAGPRGYCIGCLRSRDERFEWHNKAEVEQAQILKRLAQRQRRRDSFLATLKQSEAASSQDTPTAEQLGLPGLPDTE